MSNTSANSTEKTSGIGALRIKSPIRKRQPSSAEPANEHSPPLIPTTNQHISARGLIAPARRPAAAPSAPITPEAAPKRRSAAELTVPSRAARSGPPPRTACEPPRTQAERGALYDRLRALRDSFPPEVNSSDRAVALIAASISGGFCTEREIIRAVAYLGFTHGRAAMVLKTGTGNNRESGHWRRERDGRYRLLD